MLEPRTLLVALACLMAGCDGQPEHESVLPTTSELVESPRAVAAANERASAGDSDASRPPRATIESPKLGVPISAKDVAAWNINVAPDGSGLPVGSGTPAQGKVVYESICMTCHGAEGKAGSNHALVGGVGSLAKLDAKRTIGSYWMYSTTIYDYVRRAMPYHAPKTLSNDQVYAVVAYLLNLNGIIGADEVMNAKTLPLVKMPNAGGFVAVDAPHPDTFLAKKR